jgi:hypothetical protein
MSEKERQQLEDHLRRLEQQRLEAKRKLRALARQTRDERWYRCGELVELAGLARLDPATLLGGLCELATHVTDAATAERWHATGEARLAAYRRRKAHRKTSASPAATSDTTPFSACEGR